MATTLTVTGIVNEVNDWKLFGDRHCCGRRVKLRGFLARRQGQPGAYAGLFAPVKGEIAEGYRFYTGDLSDRAAMRACLGEIVAEPRRRNLLQPVWQ